WVGTVATRTLPATRAITPTLLITAFDADSRLASAPQSSDRSGNFIPPCHGRREFYGESTGFRASRRVRWRDTSPPTRYFAPTKNPEYSATTSRLASPTMIH